MQEFLRDTQAAFGEPLLEQVLPKNLYCGKAVFILLFMLNGLAFGILLSSAPSTHNLQQTAITMPLQYIQPGRVQRVPHLTRAWQLMQPAGTWRSMQSARARQFFRPGANAASEDAVSTAASTLSELGTLPDSVATNFKAESQEAERQYKGDTQKHLNRTSNGKTPAFRIVLAEASQLTSIINVANWAYRGKHEVDAHAWTGERHLISGIRTTRENTAKMIANSQDPRAREALLVAVPAIREDSNEDVLGTVQVTCLDSDDGPPAIAEIGFFAVDPDLQGQGIGSALLNAAEHYATMRFGAVAAVMWVISVRHDILEWYKRSGYTLTGDTVDWSAVAPPTGVGTPRVEGLQFVRLKKPLQ